MVLRLFRLVIFVAFSIGFLIPKKASTWAFTVTGSPPSTFSTPSPSGEYTLPYPGILPDHPLYFLKEWRDKILEWTTQDPSKKVNLYILFADKHLMMGTLLYEKGNVFLARETFLKGEKYLLTSSSLLSKLKAENNLSAGLADKVESSAKKHHDVLLSYQNRSANDEERSELGRALEINNQAIQQVLSIK